MGKDLKNKGYGALNDVDPKEAGDAVEKIVKVLKDLFK